MGPGQLAQPVTQPHLVVRPHWSRATLGGAVLAGDAAGAALGDPEAGLQVPHGPAAALRDQKFPSASSLSMSMSNAWLATSRLSRAFSASSSLEPLGLTRLHPAVLGPPAVPGRLADLQRPQDLGQVLAIVQQPLALADLPHRLLRGVPVSLHVIVLLPTVWAIGLSQRVDQLQGLPSPLLLPSSSVFDPSQRARSEVVDHPLVQLMFTRRSQ